MLRRAVRAPLAGSDGATKREHLTPLSGETRNSVKMAMQTTIVLALASAILLALAVISQYRYSAHRRRVEEFLFFPDSISEFDRPRRARQS